MYIKLRIAFTPNEMEHETCGICGEAFEPGSVLAEGIADEGGGIGALCRACIEALEDRNPEFVTVSELDQAQRDFPEPVFASEEEAERAELRRDGSYDEAFGSSFLVRASK